MSIIPVTALLVFVYGLGWAWGSRDRRALEEERDTYKDGISKIANFKYEYENGHVTGAFTMENGWLIAEGMARLLGDPPAPNFVSYSANHRRLGKLDIIVQRVDKKPVAEVLLELREELAKVKAELAAKS